jgi:hypothetical protein
MSMLTLTSKTRFGAMRGCQEQIRGAYEAKADNILLVGWRVTFGIKARLTGCPMGSPGSLKGVDCNIPYQRVRTWGRALYEHAYLDL